ncbi:MAG TPA: hypothetical protein VK668_12520 [Mucilaginibacter sp.]|jgi:hypothetical protein|nr:hypothetical protein [Mucilaginibacter sp.]
MKTIIEDNELNTELQELYLVSKKWISDLEFLDSELEFLKKLFQTHSFVQFLEQDLAMLLKLDNAHSELKSDVTLYMHLLEPLIVDPEHKLNVDLIEIYAKLESRLAEILLNFRTLRATAFTLNKNELKAAQPPK